LDYEEFMETICLRHRRSNSPAPHARGSLIKGNVKEEKIPKNEQEQLRTEIRGTKENLAKEHTTVAKTLPRLRHIASVINIPGASRTSKGTWLHSEDTRAGTRKHPPPASQESRKEPQSPNLLESSQQSSQQSQQKEESQEETKEESQEETKEASQEDTQAQQNLTLLKLNPCFDLSFASHENSSDASHIDD
jgi:cobalamin biosynthesis protein CobT